MTIQHTDDNKKGMFFIMQDAERIAEMTYVHTGKTLLIIDHTFVADDLRGQGVGMQLLDATAQYARTNSLKLMATCPYAKAQLAQHSDRYADVVKS